MSHTIRLTGPWQVVRVEPLQFAEGGVKETESLRVKMPKSWQDLFGPVSGEAVFLRTFNKPTGIDRERIFLSIEDLKCSGHLMFNDNIIHRFPQEEDHLYIDITDQLQLTNKLSLYLHCNPLDNDICGLHRPVTLKIQDE